MKPTPTPLTDATTTIYDVPLGTRFRYANAASDSRFVLLDRANCGLIAKWGDGFIAGQQVFSFAGTRAELLTVKIIAETDSHADLSARCAELEGVVKASEQMRQEWREKARNLEAERDGLRRRLMGDNEGALLVSELYGDISELTKELAATKSSRAARRGVAKMHSLYGAVAHEIEELEEECALHKDATAEWKNQESSRNGDLIRALERIAALSPVDGIDAAAIAREALK